MRRKRNTGNGIKVSKCRDTIALPSWRLLYTSPALPTGAGLSRWDIPLGYPVGISQKYPDYPILDIYVILFTSSFGSCRRGLIVTPITWKNEQRKLSQLIPWEHNPRQITEKQGAHLQKSIRKFGFALPFLISPENDIYDGHQRKALMGIMQEYGYDAEIDCRMSSRMLTEDEQDEFVIRLRENTGEYDWDILANHFEVPKLVEWGMPEWKLDKTTGGWNGEGINPSLIPDDGRYKEQYGVIIICSDAIEQETVYNEMNDSGYMCRVVVT